MTRDEIYDHLAQVYLGKRSDKVEGKKKRQFNAWLVINIVLTIVILASTFYGFTAFLTNRGEYSRKSVIFALNNGPIRISYNLNSPYPQVKTFSLRIPKMNVSRYEKLSFSIRGLEEGSPGIVKVLLKNQKNETATYYVKGVRLKWRTLNIPFDEFTQITDWTTVTDVAFVIEAWNAEKKTGIILIDNICFSS